MPIDTTRNADRLQPLDILLDVHVRGPHAPEAAEDEKI